MFTRNMLKSKIHRATVTRKDFHYHGSLTVDPVLLRAADILEWEKVQVLDLDSGSRFETYVMEGIEGSGELCLNGPAARLGEIGDRLLIITYASIEESELEELRPIVVHVDEATNRITEVARSTVRPWSSRHEEPAPA
jgi:aspartate 1-decarboxylase